MKRIKSFSDWLLPTLALTITLFLSTVEAQEHPKEHPSTEKKGATLTPETLAREITQYIEKESKLKGGYFLFFDEKSNQPLVLTLDKVHKGSLSRVAERTYFACTDFKSKDGKTYDLDFFLRETDFGLQPSEIAVHKENGKERYMWIEEEGIWKRQEKK